MCVRGLFIRRPAVPWGLTYMTSAIQEILPPLQTNSIKQDLHAKLYLNLSPKQFFCKQSRQEAQKLKIPENVIYGSPLVSPLAVPDRFEADVVAFLSSSRRRKRILFGRAHDPKKLPQTRDLERSPY